MSKKNGSQLLLTAESLLQDLSDEAASMITGGRRTRTRTSGGGRTRTRTGR
jgi:hypothetical protein